MIKIWRCVGETKKNHWCSLMENSMEVPQKTKNRITIWSHNPPSRHISKTLNQKDTCTPMFTIALFIIAKTWQLPKCLLTDEWIKKMWYIYIYIYTHKNTHTQKKNWNITQPWKEWNNGICCNLDGIRYYHTKWSKSQREKNTIWYHSHMESKNMTQINLSMKQKQTHRHREQTCGCLARWEKGGMGICG